MTIVLKRKREDAERHMREEDHKKTETKIEVMQLQAKECQGLPGAVKARKRQRRIPPQSLERENNPANILI